MKKPGTPWWVLALFALVVGGGTARALFEMRADEAAKRQAREDRLGTARTVECEALRSVEDGQRVVVYGVPVPIGMQCPNSREVVPILWTRRADAGAEPVTITVEATWRRGALVDALPND